MGNWYFKCLLLVKDFYPWLDSLIPKSSHSCIHSFLRSDVITLRLAFEVDQNQA